METLAEKALEAISALVMVALIAGVGFFWSHHVISPRDAIIQCGHDSACRQQVAFPVRDTMGKMLLSK